MLMWRPPVDYMNNVDNYSKLTTLFVYFVHSPVIGGLTRGSPAHGLPLHLEAVGVVYKAVHNRVRVGGIADLVMPAIQRDWTVRLNRTAYCHKRFPTVISMDGRRPIGYR